MKQTVPYALRINTVLTSGFAFRYALLNGLIDTKKNDGRIVNYTRATVEPEHVVLEITVLNMTLANREEHSTGNSFTMPVTRNGKSTSKTDAAGKIIALDYPRQVPLFGFLFMALVY
ncbi:unnamed protein product [Echinostoma caproni]|uniref:Carboxypeptidase regulatory-like domain-containing protein n=1 Tax=Echinostoma caproni TaxID=27848 RepID=A0A183BC91_9TREM|nr:unnamed protein product [Echinostoma caproni]